MILLLIIGILSILAGVSFIISGRIYEEPIYWSCFLFGAIFIFEYYKLKRKQSK